MGIQGTSGIKIYDLNIVSTGMTEEIAKATTPMNIASCEITTTHRAEVMVIFEEVIIKIDADTKRLLDGQIASKYDLTETMNTFISSNSK
ncbi:hypothetical protein [Cellulosilyticum ruminicola]|uniref:hypothetical protein n=1 Tax=Cellulosilyticum ruminicola TaxID=425254 RepID=UPI0006CF3518|nr:hypothetical protein [Cellulosilyticum ruminicola]